MRSLIFVLAGLFALPASPLVPHFWRGQTLTAKDAAKKWGRAPFDSKKFRGGDPKIKGSMAADLMSHPDKYLRKNPAAIRSELGDPDGFYFRDSFPAYVIDDTPENVWQIVFLLDNDFKVGGIIVHKNCCD